jgi:hypothetical protein
MNTSILDALGGASACTGTESVDFQNNIFSGGNYNPYDSAAGHCIGWNYVDDVKHNNNLYFNVGHPLPDYSPGVGELRIDPQFNADYSLKSTSPAIDKGALVTFSDTSQDFNKATRVSPYDMGALEFSACIPDNSCANLTPACEQTVTCTDNCGTVFTAQGPVCPPPPVVKNFTTLSAYESWLTTSTIKAANTAPIIRWIKVGSTTTGYQYFKVTHERTTP